MLQPQSSVPSRFCTFVCSSSVKYYGPSRDYRTEGKTSQKNCEAVTIDRPTGDGRYDRAGEPRDSSCCFFTVIEANLLSKGRNTRDDGMTKATWYIVSHFAADASEARGEKVDGSHHDADSMIGIRKAHSVVLLKQQIPGRAQSNH